MRKENLVQSKKKIPIYVGLLPTVEVFLTLCVVSFITIFFLYKKFKELQAKNNSCILSKDWSAYGVCSRNCGSDGWQFSTRSVVQLETKGGEPCKIEDMLRSQSCPGNALQCGKACVPGNPSVYTWSSCPTCTRPGELPTQYKIVPPLSPATTGGQDCQISDVFFSQTCNTVVQACPPDIDCELELYASSSCALGPCENTGQTGVQFLYFRVVQQQSGRGKECDFRDLVQVQACADNTQPCNCNSGNPNDWGAFSECNASCGPGIQASIRKVPLANCPNVSFTVCSYTSCENSTCVPPSIDLVRAECYLLCAGLPTSTLAPGFCSASSIFTAVCADLLTGGSGCAQPQDCSLSSWSNFSTCPQQCDPQNLFGTVTERTRYIVQPSQGGGKSCNDPSLVFQDFEPCANWVNISYTAYNTDTNNFQSSVSLAQCFPQVCSYSAWYSISSCQNPLMCSNSEYPFGQIILNRSITSGASGCSTDPTQYFSYSNCTLPACTSCLWSNTVLITNETRSFLCSQESVSVGFLPNTLVSQTNIAGVTCDDYQKSCSANESDNLVPGQQGTCSSFYFSCPQLAKCPIDASNRVCSGNGEYEYFFNEQSGSFSCRCSCFPQYSGNSCSDYVGSCPIASVSGLMCNGMGSCVAQGSGFSCSCYNSLNTTSDCSGETNELVDHGWCWINETVKSTLPNEKAVVLKKLLGAQRISNQFSFESCTELALHSQQLSQVLATSFSVPFTNVFLSVPTNLKFNVGVSQTVQQTSTLSINSAFLEGIVQPFSPPNLVASLSLYHLDYYYSNFNDITAQEILLALGYGIPSSETIGNQSVSSNYLSFKPVLDSNAIPVSIASPLYFTTYIDPNLSLQSYGTVQSQSLSQYFLPSVSGNVFTPGTPEQGTYTQIRWLTFNSFSRDTISGFKTYVDQRENFSNLSFSYIQEEKYTMGGAFNAWNLNVDYSDGSGGGNDIGFEQRLQVQLLGEITKHFNDPNPLTEKLKVNNLTITFPYLEAEKFSYSYNLGTETYTDNRMIAMTNFYESLFDATAPVLPRRNYFIYCNGLANADCLARRVLWNPKDSGYNFLQDETQPLTLNSIRFTSAPVGSVGPNGIPIAKFAYDPCSSRANNSLYEETLNHPECSTNFQDFRGLFSDTKYSLSSYNCNNGQGQHRTNPMGSIFTCKLFQWFAKYGQGSAMPITISYSYD